jgi:hypothetical protein
VAIPWPAAPPIAIERSTFAITNPLWLLGRNSLR